MTRNTDETRTNGWSQWSIFVLKELERLTECIKQVETTVNEIHTELQVHKEQFRQKASVWGLVGGAIPVAIMIGVYVIKTFSEK